MWKLQHGGLLSDEQQLKILALTDKEKKKHWLECYLEIQKELCTAAQLELLKEENKELLVWYVGQKKRSLCVEAEMKLLQYPSLLEMYIGRFKLYDEVLLKMMDKPELFDCLWKYIGQVKFSDAAQVKLAELDYAYEFLKCYIDTHRNLCPEAQVKMLNLPEMQRQSLLQCLCDFQVTLCDEAQMKLFVLSDYKVLMRIYLVSGLKLCEKAWTKLLG